MYSEFLTFVETSWLGQVARSSVWLYPLANLAHVLGAALLVGSIIVFDVLLLRRRYAEASAVSRYALTIAAAGLLILLLTGPILFSAEATATGRNPVFLIKVALILAAARLRAGVSAGLWIAVLLAGRSIAYW
jgi:hypothetical protein